MCVVLIGGGLGESFVYYENSITRKNNCLLTLFAIGQHFGREILNQGEIIISFSVMKYYNTIKLSISIMNIYFLNSPKHVVSLWIFVLNESMFFSVGMSVRKKIMLSKYVILCAKKFCIVFSFGYRLNTR